MKVYILKENIFNYTGDTEPYSEIIGVYSEKEKAIEERRKIIVDNVLNYNFIPDEQHKGKDPKTIELFTMFWNYPENWNNYIELEIIKKEIL